MKRVQISPHSPHVAMMRLMTEIWYAHSSAVPRDRTYNRTYKCINSHLPILL
jgi:hypothetical protein